MFSFPNEFWHISFKQSARNSRSKPIEISFKGENLFLFYADWVISGKRNMISSKIEFRIYFWSKSQSVTLIYGYKQSHLKISNKFQQTFTFQDFLICYSAISSLIASITQGEQMETHSEEDKLLSFNEKRINKRFHLSSVWRLRKKSLLWEFHTVHKLPIKNW